MIFSDRSIDLAISAFLIKYYDLQNSEDILSELYPFIELDAVTSEQFDDLFTIASLPHSINSNFYTAINNDKEKIILKLFEIVANENDFLRIRDLFDIDYFDYKSFLKKHRDRLQKLLNEFWSDENILTKIDDEDFSEIFEEDEMISQLNKIESGLAKINEELELDPSPGFKTLYKWDYKGVLEENRDKNQADDEDKEYEAPILNTKSPTQINEDPAVRASELFENLLESKIQNAS